MRIAITGASGQVGALLGERLAAAAHEVTPLGRGEDWAAAITGADAVAALAGTLQPARGEDYRAANVETAATAAAAAADAAVTRLAFLSYVGAAPDSRNEYLRAKAEAENLLLGSGVPTTIFRCLHIYGPPARPGPTAAALLAHSERPVVVPGSGSQRIAPLYVGDVVAALFGALTAPEPAGGRFELGGPEEMAMDEFVEALNGGAARIRHLPAPVARLAARFSPSLTPALIDLLLRDNVTATDPAEIGARFGFEPHRLADVWPAPAPAV